jgi:hypothetical protein
VLPTRCRAVSSRALAAAYLVTSRRSRMLRTISQAGPGGIAGMPTLVAGSSSRSRGSARLADDVGAPRPPSGYHLACGSPKRFTWSSTIA